MHEAAPKEENIKTRKEVFKLLFRKVGSFADLDAILPAKYKVGKENTEKALSFLNQAYVNKQLPLPKNWEGFTSDKTPFYFIRRDDGVVVANPEPYYFATPAAFITKLQTFYKLDQLTVAEVEAELAAAKAAEEAKEKTDMEAIRSGEWVKSRMPEPLQNEPAPQVVTPRRTSVFRPQR